MCEKNDILITLGGPNDADGTLSPIALGRADRTIEEYRNRPGCRILLCGGYGKHFNTTDKPHASYLQTYVTSCGVPECAILGWVEASNTVEEAVMVHRILEGKEVGRLFVITSDFHCRRAGLIFNHVLSEYDVTVVEVSVNLPAEEVASRKRHEENAMRRIQQQGGIILPDVP